MPNKNRTCAPHRTPKCLLLFTPKCCNNLESHVFVMNSFFSWMMRSHASKRFSQIRSTQKNKSIHSSTNSRIVLEFHRLRFIWVLVLRETFHCPFPQQQMFRLISCLLFFFYFFLCQFRISLQHRKHTDNLPSVAYIINKFIFLISERWRVHRIQSTQFIWMQRKSLFCTVTVVCA